MTVVRELGVVGGWWGSRSQRKQQARRLPLMFHVKHPDSLDRAQWPTECAVPARLILLMLSPSLDLYGLPRSWRDCVFRVRWPCLPGRMAITHPDRSRLSPAGGIVGQPLTTRASRHHRWGLYPVPTFGSVLAPASAGCVHSPYSRSARPGDCVSWISELRVNAISWHRVRR